LLIKLLMVVLIRLQKCTRFNIKPAVKYHNSVYFKKIQERKR
jgi:hypothetical protein